MADNVSITPGSGVSIRTDDVGGVQFQYVKLDVGGDGVSKPVFQGGTDGLPVDLLSSPATGLYIRPAAAQTFPVSIAATVAISAASALPVSALVGAPAFVRLSDGASPITTLPVSGTVTANQGTAAAAASAWFMKITDGTNSVGISDVSGAKALKVDVIQSITTDPTLVDEATFTAATTRVVPIAAVFNDSIAQPSSGQLGGLRMTQRRAMHMNIRKDDGTELGIAATPLRVDPTGTTKQPANLFDSSGNAYTDANPLPMAHAVFNRTRVTKSIALSASQTAAVVWTPTGGKKFIITSIELLISVTGALTIFDGTNAAGNLVTDGLSGAWAVGRHVFNHEAWPWASATVDNVLKYTSGTGLTGTLTVHGFEV